MKRAKRTVTVRRRPEEVFRFWLDLENLPRFMGYLQAVEPAGDRRCHWIVGAPGEETVDWETETVEEVENERIGWRSLADGDVQYQAYVRLREAPADRGTEVEVEIEYEAGGGSAGRALAKLFGKDPEDHLRDDLRRFKQVMETGEVVLSEGSLEGAGEGAGKERAAQAPEVEARP
jgi:uncharacterized membrane protein